MYTVKLESFVSGGEKALGLAKLSRKGFPVPKAFVVTMEAFQKFLQANNSPESEQMQNSPIPNEVLADIKEEYEDLSVDKELKSLGGPALDLIKAGREQAFVAVRGRGFTRLNVKGFSQLQEALKEVWSRCQEEVIIQKMVDSEKMGIVSPHPTQDIIQIEASWGLALPVESNPDLFLVSQDGVKEKLGQKEWLIARDAYSGKTVKEAVPGDRKAARTLNSQEVNALISLGSEVESFLSSKASMEFAIERGKLWLLTAEPFQKKSFPETQVEGEPLTQGDIITPGIVKGFLRSPNNIQELGADDILLAKALKPGFLKEALGGIITEKGSVQKLASIVKVPSMRVDSLSGLQEGSHVLLDAVRGAVYPVQEPAQPQEIQEAHPGRERVKVSSIITSHYQEPRGDGSVIRAESLLTDSKHPSLLARESPEDVISMLEGSLESLARSLFPKPLLYTAFDGRSDELRSLEGAEPQEQNPMLGFHGIRKAMEDSVFGCELEALRRLYEKGLHNITLLLPFASRPEEFSIARERITFPLKIGILVETPSSALDIESFCKEGACAIHINLDTLTQLTLGMDMDNPRFSSNFQVLPQAVEKLVRWVVQTCQKSKVPTSAQGIACSNPETVQSLLNIGIETIAADQDSFEAVRAMLQ